MRFKEIVASKIITESKLPDCDFVINPYTGCQFACLYCYASFMGRFVRHENGGPEPISEWGNYVYVKKNAVELAVKELAEWTEKHPELLRSSVLMSSVTDPYQGVEAKYKLTRGILEAFVAAQFPGVLGILTKSPLVTRDIDLLKQIRNADVGMTVTTTDDNVSRFLEVSAPLVSRRIKTLKQLNEEGIPTYAFIGPLLPHFRFQPELLDELFASLALAGVRQVYVEHMNLKTNNVRERLFNTLENEPQEVRDIYQGVTQNEHREALDKIVAELLAKNGLTIRLGEVLYHNEKDGKGEPNAQLGASKH